MTINDITNRHLSHSWKIEKALNIASFNQYEAPNYHPTTNPYDTNYTQTLMVINDKKCKFAKHSLPNRTL